MGALWFWIVVAMLTAYVVLDGFDIGVGIVFPFVARTEEERQHAFRSIGPVWDGNEVWLIAAGGTLFFAFPLLYASAFSGFYMPLMIVLWLLILRGLAVELRMHSQEALWHSFFDGLFFVSSAALAIFFGAALANVIRGVPIGPDHYFYLPLWTNWQTGPNPGILDWYTVMGGVMALLALSIHGALYISLKTEDHLERRARIWAKRLLPLVTLCTILAIPATVLARPDSLHNYRIYPIAFLAPIAVVASLAALTVALRRRSELGAFFSSCAYLAAMLCGAAAGLFPVLLPSTNPNREGITIANALAGPHAIRVGLAWWIFGILLALLYFGIVYWLFRGKVTRHLETYSH
jgi:cytochrome d ubiquinol oxidase subunit II